MDETYSEVLLLEIFSVIMGSCSSCVKCCCPCWLQCCKSESDIALEEHSRMIHRLHVIDNIYSPQAIRPANSSATEMLPLPLDHQRQLRQVKRRPGRARSQNVQENTNSITLNMSEDGEYVYEHVPDSYRRTIQSNRISDQHEEHPPSNSSTSEQSTTSPGSRSHKKQSRVTSYEEDILNFMTAVIENENSDAADRERLLNNASELLEDVRRSNSRRKSGDPVLNTIPEESNRAELTCPICFDPLKGGSMCATACGHLFCEKCIFMHLEESDLCPSCRKKTYIGGVRKIYL